MVQVKHFGKHENILFADFGNGDIRMTQAKYESNKYETMLMFHNESPREIGEVADDFYGKTSDELNAPAFVMTFSRPESITALIHSLIELQKSVFKHVQTNP